MEYLGTIPRNVVNNRVDINNKVDIDSNDKGKKINNICSEMYDELLKKTDESISSINAKLSLFKENKNTFNLIPSHLNEEKLIAYNNAKISERNYYKNKVINSIDELNVLSRELDNNYPTDSLHDLFNDVKESIVSGKSDYLDVLKEIFSKYMKFVNELREILSKLSEYTEAGSKDGYVNVNTSKLLSDLQALRDKYAKAGFFDLSMFFKKDEQEHFHRDIDGNSIYYENNDSVDDAANAVQKLLEELKGFKSEKKDNSIPPDISFSFDVGIDLSSLDKLIESLGKQPSGAHDILQTEFDLLKKSLDAFEKNINTNLDELSKKYSTANSNYDNFVKIVSSTMNTLLEMAKGFLRF